MKTKEECMELIKSCADTLRHRFGVSSFRLFGSVLMRESIRDHIHMVILRLMPNIIYTTVKEDLAPLLEATRYFIEMLSKVSTPKLGF